MQAPVRGANGLRCFAGLSDGVESRVVSGEEGESPLPSKSKEVLDVSIEESVSCSKERTMPRNSSMPMMSVLFSRANEVICDAMSPVTRGEPCVDVYASKTRGRSIADNLSPPCSWKRARTIPSSQRSMLA